MRIVTAVVLLLLAGCAQPEPLPAYGSVPAFSLTDQTGAEYGSDALAGYVWVADFVFTRCAGPCPRLSRHMAKLQDALGDEPRVRFVSVSVDPEYDTPERLADYAKRFGADTATWSFLTGGKKQIYGLISDGFKLAVRDGELGPDGEPGSGIITHSTRFVLVDAKGQIRGYFSGDTETTGGEISSEIVGSVERLLAEGA